MKRALSACVASLVLVVGCSSSSSSAPADTGPVIDAVQAATTAKAGAQWDLTITFHESNGHTLKSARLQMKDLGVDMSSSMSGQTANAAGLVLGVTMDPKTPVGAHPYIVSLIDEAGVEGAGYSGTVTVQ